MAKHSRTLIVLNDPRWTAVVARDASADGWFFYAVRTTGVFCRPSCSARLPLPENVEIFESLASAEAAGFRACKRCRPREPSRQTRNAMLVAQLCRKLERADPTPTLEVLARSAKLSTFHTHRMFKEVTGLTPRAYALAHRAKRLERVLRSERTVTAAIYEAGYGSPARFYERSMERLGMTPSALRSGAKGLAIRAGVARCSLGLVLVAATDVGVCAILLGDDPNVLMRDLERRFPGAHLLLADPRFDDLVERVIDLVESRGSRSELPLDIRGTAFQERVWRALQEIPPGNTKSYAAVAKAIGAPQAARAVASACAANPLAVAVPCHRVVRTDGELSGYRWGIARKRALLDRETKT